MKINIREKTDMMTIEARLLSIDQVTRKNTDIIVVMTDAGNFSNYKTIFEKQKLDVDTLNEGDELKISYVIYTAKNNVEFKNFVKIERA